MLRQRNQPARRRPVTVLAVVTVACCGVATAACATQVRPAAQVKLTARPSAGAPVTAAPGAGAARSAATMTSSHSAARATTAAPAAPAAGGTASAPAGGSTTVPGAAGCPMFPADNVWNTDISELPVNSRSAAWLASMDAAGTYLHPDFGPDPGGYPYGIPFKLVTNSHPRVPVRFAYSSESNRGPYPFGSDTPIEGGKKAGGDRHAIMINSQTCTLYELWNARYSAKGATAGSGATWKLRSNSLRPAGWTSADAAGLPVLPGLLSFVQVQAAVRSGKPITHAIRFTAERTQSAYIWPARHAAGSGSSRNLPPMGARFRLKGSFDVARFCASASTRYCRAAKAILVEMQHYGLILADNGSNWYFQGAASPHWPDGLISLLKRIPARAFQAVDESCLKVHRSSGQASAKPGCPIG